MACERVRNSALRFPSVFYDLLHRARVVVIVDGGCLKIIQRRLPRIGISDRRVSRRTHDWPARICRVQMPIRLRPDA